MRNDRNIQEARIQKNILKRHKFKKYINFTNTHAHTWRCAHTHTHTHIYIYISLLFV